MRALILIALTLALAACGKNAQTDNTENIDESLTAENIVSNDVTAIDAVTGDAANMAAESPVGNLDTGPIENTADNLGNAIAPAKPAAKRPRPKTTTKPAGPAPAATNATSNAATNAAQ